MENPLIDSLKKVIKDTGSAYRVQEERRIHSATLNNWVSGTHPPSPKGLPALLRVLPFLSKEDFTTVPNAAGKGGQNGVLVLTPEGAVKCNAFKEGKETPTQAIVPRVTLREGASIPQTGGKTRKVKGAKVTTNLQVQIIGDIVHLCRDPALRERILRVCDYLETMNLNLSEILRATD